MTVKGCYYIHSPDHWNDDDLKAIKSSLGKEYEFDITAARGEGAGGAGFDTLVEFVITNPISSGILSAMIYDIVKHLVSRLPNKRPDVPRGIPASYRLVVHTNSGIIALNLDGDIKDIEIAMSSMPDLAKEKKSRAYQNGKHWDVY